MFSGEALVDVLICERVVRMGGRFEEGSKWEKSPRGDGGNSPDPGGCCGDPLRLSSNSGESSSSDARGGEA